MLASEPWRSATCWVTLRSCLAAVHCLMVRSTSIARSVIEVTESLLHDVGVGDGPGRELGRALQPGVASHCVFDGEHAGLDRQPVQVLDDSAQVVRLGPVGQSAGDGV